MYVCMHACMYVCMYVFMCVYIYIYIITCVCFDVCESDTRCAVLPYRILLDRKSKWANSSLIGHPPDAHAVALRTDVLNHVHITLAWFQTDKSDATDVTCISTYNYIKGGFERRLFDAAAAPELRRSAPTLPATAERCSQHARRRADAWARESSRDFVEAPPEPFI